MEGALPKTSHPRPLPVGKGTSHQERDILFRSHQRPAGILKYYSPEVAYVV
jgi:hypothetical protein